MDFTQPYREHSLENSGIVVSLENSGIVVSLENPGIVVSLENSVSQIFARKKSGKIVKIGFSDSRDQNKILKFS